MNRRLWLRKERTVPRIMVDAVAALAALSLLPLVYYGPRVAVLLLSGVLGASAAEGARFFLFRRRAVRFNGSAVVTGMITALLLPANAPVWLPAAGALFGVAVGKLPVRRGGCNILNPAAVGIAFLTACWPERVFGYCLPQRLPLLQDCQVTLVLSPGAFLKEGMKPEILPYELLWGQYPGPMGTVFAVVIAACALFLILRGNIRWYVPAVFLGTAAVAAALFPRFVLSPLASVKYELLSGSLFFCAVFMMTDPVTSPRTRAGMLCFAALGGASVMLLRWFGPYEEGVCFAVLFGNLLTPLLDGAVCVLREKRFRKKRSKKAEKETEPSVPAEPAEPAV